MGMVLCLAICLTFFRRRFLRSVPVFRGVRARVWKSFPEWPALKGADSAAGLRHAAHSAGHVSASQPDQVLSWKAENETAVESKTEFSDFPTFGFSNSEQDASLEARLLLCGSLSVRLQELLEESGREIRTAAPALLLFTFSMFAQ